MTQMLVLKQGQADIRRPYIDTAYLVEVPGSLPAHETFAAALNGKPLGDYLVMPCPREASADVAYTIQHLRVTTAIHVVHDGEGEV